MVVTMRLFSACVVLCVGSGLAAWFIPRPRRPTDCVKFHNFIINSEWGRDSETNPSEQEMRLTAGRDTQGIL
jgi:hypothetical protein